MKKKKLEHVLQVTAHLAHLTTPIIKQNTHTCSQLCSKSVTITVILTTTIFECTAAHLLVPNQVCARQVFSFNKRTLCV